LVCVPKQADGATAQALHGKRKVSQTLVPRQGLAQQAQLPCVQPILGPAVGGARHGVAQPAPLTQEAHQALALGIDRVTRFVMRIRVELILTPAV
jgi:hypothetical protein